MASFSSRKRYDAEDYQAQLGNATHELASSGLEAVLHPVQNSKKFATGAI
jgi:hypothetical protein